MGSYINTSTGEYPISFAKLKLRMPNTSFSGRPDSIGEYHLVKDGPVPAFDGDIQYVTEGEPILSGGSYVRNWVVQSYTQGEVDKKIANRNAVASSSVRRQRDNLLADSDWRVIKAQETGTPMSQAWVDYRQALRDITNQTGFPHDVVWPTKPE